MKNVTVIVSQCVKGTAENEGRIFGDRLVTYTFYSVEEALLEGKFQSADGRCVIVRPTYNEEDDKGHFYREFRSFNGEAFKEIRFSIG